jgi:hypothetical protein
MAWFFLLQAALPWGCALAASWLWDRPLVLDRCLLFAQVGLFGLWGVTWSCLRGWPARIWLACFLGLPCLYGLSERLREMPGRPPALAEAANFLAEYYRDGDVILIQDYREVNRVRYYAAQAGLREVDVRAPFNPLGQAGHVVHLASLDSQDIFFSQEELLATVRGRVWRGGEEMGWETAPPGMRRVLRHDFDGGGGTRYTLTLYQRAD